MSKGKHGKSGIRKRATFHSDSNRRKKIRRGHSKRYGSREEMRAEKAAEKREVDMLKETMRGDDEAKKLAAQPHSFVIHRGKVGRYVRQLERDLRSVMEPFTASKLKEMKRNNLKDFLLNGAVLGMTHLLILTRGEQSITLRIIHSSQGPTLSFKILRYSLTRDVVSSQRRPFHFQHQFINPPLVVMNGLMSCQKKHVQLAQTMFRNMFPSINVDEVKLSKIRRCVLINYDAETDVFELRHYAIKTVPAGLSRATKKIVQGKVPDLSRYKDISDYFLNPGQISESEFEEEEKEVELSQDLMSRGCKAGQLTHVRLVELGPRLTMVLMKVEDGVNDGEVLYHSYMQKTANELMELRRNISKKRKVKERQQKENEHRVIRRLKAIAEKEAAAEAAISEEKQKIINRQRAVTGEGDDRQEEQQANLLLKKRLSGGREEGQNQSAEPPSEKRRRSGGTHSGKATGDVKAKKVHFAQRVATVV
uniref:Brix domain-containing protein n=3 Tax=Parascaris univalens TaxID=6257 RepID=A0A915C0R9_PARUN